MLYIWKGWGKKCSTFKKENPEEKGKECVINAQLTKKIEKLERKLNHMKIGKKKCDHYKLKSKTGSD